MASPTRTKPFVTLEALELSAIPTSGPELTAFLSQVVSEAAIIIDEVKFPAVAPWSHHSTKSCTTHDKVEVTVKELPHETWYSRRSVHELGEHLRWDEFTGNLLRGHAPNEKEYIPSVNRVDEVATVQWDLTSVQVDGWKDLEMGVWGLQHGMPWPISPRVFPILLILAESCTTQEFLVISIPVIIATDTVSSAGDTVIGKTTLGKYVAVERVRVHPPGSKVPGLEQAKGEVAEWSTATASSMYTLYVHSGFEISC